MKTLKNKLATITLLLLTVLSISGCSKDDDSPPRGTATKVVFKAEVSSGSTLNMAVYGYDTHLTTASGLNSQSWTSPEITVPNNATVVSIMSNAVGADAAATLKVRIFVNGVLKKEATSTGTALSATAQYNM